MKRFVWFTPVAPAPGMVVHLFMAFVGRMLWARLALDAGEKIKSRYCHRLSPCRDDS